MRGAPMPPSIANIDNVKRTRVYDISPMSTPRAQFGGKLYQRIVTPVGGLRNKQHPTNIIQKPRLLNFSLHLRFNMIRRNCLRLPPHTVGLIQTPKSPKNSSFNHRSSPNM